VFGVFLQSNSVVMTGKLDCAPVITGLGAEPSAAVLRRPVGAIFSHGADPKSVDQQLTIDPSEAEALALFQATLVMDGPLPPPIVNFDEDVLLASLIKDTPSSSLGSKNKKVRNKNGKKGMFRPTAADVVSDDRAFLQALRDPNVTPGNIERIFGRCASQIIPDIT